MKDVFVEYSCKLTEAQVDASHRRQVRPQTVLATAAVDCAADNKS